MRVIENDRNSSSSSGSATAVVYACGSHFLGQIGIGTLGATKVLHTPLQECMFTVDCVMNCKADSAHLTVVFKANMRENAANFSAAAAGSSTQDSVQIATKSSDF